MGALRGMATGALALIAFETFASSSSTQVTGLFGTVTNLVNRALSSDVPLIPDRRLGTTDGDGNFHPTIPGWLGGGTTTAPGGGTSGQQQNPNYVPYDPPPIGQNNPQYSNPHPNQPGGVLE